MKSRQCSPGGLFPGALGVLSVSGLLHNFRTEPVGAQLHSLLGTNRRYFLVALDAIAAWLAIASSLHRHRIRRAASRAANILPSHASYPFT